VTSSLPLVADPRFRTAFVLIVALTGVGVFGYHHIEGYSWIDALYMTVITLSTVGYREVMPLSPVGKIFTVFLIVFGIGLVLTIVGMWASMVLEGEFQRFFGRRRIERVLRDMNNHYIVCGYGTFGERVAHELRDRGTPLVVVEKAKDVSDDLVSVKGDATSDEVLLEAGIRSATGILSTMRSEAENLYITLAAKELNPDIIVVARCEREANASRLLRAGAARTISSYAVAGHRMAQAVMHPRILEFFDLVTSTSDHRMEVAEVTIGAGSFCAGASLAEANIAGRFGVTVLGIVGADGALELHPASNRRLVLGDTLLALGDEPAIEELASAAAS